MQDIPLEKVGLTPKVRPPILPKVQRNFVIDNMTTSSILDSTDPSIRRKLATRVPDLSVLPNCESGREPKAHLAFLDNKDGAVCLNIVNSVTSERTSVTLGDLIGKLDEGTPGLCTPADHKIPPQVTLFQLFYLLFLIFLLIIYIEYITFIQFLKRRKKRFSKSKNQN